MPYTVTIHEAAIPAGSDPSPHADDTTSVYCTVLKGRHEHILVNKHIGRHLGVDHHNDHCQHHVKLHEDSDVILPRLLQVSLSGRPWRQPLSTDGDALL